MRRSASPAPMIGSLPAMRLRDRRIRTKLALLLALPVIATLALTGVSAAGAASAASQAGQARQLVALGRTAGQFAAQMQRERVAAALVLARGSRASAVEEYRQQARLTDLVAGEFGAARQGVRAPQILAGTAAPGRGSGGKSGAVAPAGAGGARCDQ